MTRGFYELTELHANDEPVVMTAEERADFIEYTSHFEECCYAKHELRKMSDAELVESGYWVMAEYARGQQ